MRGKAVHTAASPEVVEPQQHEIIRDPPSHAQPQTSQQDNSNSPQQTRQREAPKVVWLLIEVRAGGSCSSAGSQGYRMSREKSAPEGGMAGITQET